MDASQSDASQVDASPHERNALLRLVAGSRWRLLVAQFTQLVVVLALVFGSVVYTIAMKPVPTQDEVDEGPLRLPGMVIHAPEMDDEVFRISTFLRRHTRDSVKAVRIADALVDQGRRRKIDPALLLGVLITEGPKLDTMAESFMGARGLMQVMPFHSGRMGCKSSNLYSIEANICHGVAVLSNAMKASSSVRAALLRYNGCVKSTNTANCHSYPDKVFRIANRATAQMLAMVPSGPPSTVTPLTLEDLQSIVQD